MVLRYNRGMRKRRFPTSNGLLTCSRCGEDKLHTEFRREDRSDGPHWHSWCDDCRKSYQRNYQRQRTEEGRELARQEANERGLAELRAQTEWLAANLPHLGPPLVRDSVSQEEIDRLFPKD